MKSLLQFGILLLIGASITSCSNVRPVMDDNVYVMNSAIVPVGEDLVDETSYATFKHRQETANPTNGYYHPANNTAIIGQSFLNSSSWFFYGRWDNYGTLSGFNFNPYWGAHRNGFYGIDMIPGMSFFTPYYGFQSYQFYYPYFMNYSGYSFGNSAFGYMDCYSSVFYNPSNYSNGYGNYPTNNTNSSGLLTSGPRQTVSGYYSGNTRGGTAQLKSSINNSNSTDIKIYNRTTTTRVDYYSSERNEPQRPVYTRPTSSDGNNARTSPRGGGRIDYTNSQGGGVIISPRENSRGTISNPRSGNSSSGSGSNGSSGSGSGSARPGGRGL